MSRVLFVAETIQNKDIQSRQKLETVFGDSFDIRTIGNIAGPESKALALSMLKGDGQERGAEHFEGLAVNCAKGQSRNAAGRVGLYCRIERIVEGSANSGFDAFAAVNRQFVAQIAGKDPQVIQSKQMIGVGVSKGRGVDQTNLLAEELKPKFRGRIDEQVALGQAEDYGAPRPPVAGVVAGAGLAGAADHGHPVRGSGSKEDELSFDRSGLGLRRHGRASGVGKRVFA